MEKATGKPTALWRKLIFFIPLGVIAFCWILIFAVYFDILEMDVLPDLFREDLTFICGMALIVSSAALVLALIPIIFIRPLSGSEEIQVLRALGRSLLYFAIAVPAISFQCYWGIMSFWGPFV